MSFIANLKIRNKSIVMVLLPIVGVLYFASIETINDYQKSTYMEELKVLVNYGGQASDLAHEIQQERGMALSWFFKLLHHRFFMLVRADNVVKIPAIPRSS